MYLIYTQGQATHTHTETKTRSGYICVWVREATRRAGVDKGQAALATHVRSRGMNTCVAAIAIIIIIAIVVIVDHIVIVIAVTHTHKKISFVAPFSDYGNIGKLSRASNFTRVKGTK